MLDLRDITITQVGKKNERDRSSMGRIHSSEWQRTWLALFIEECRLWWVGP